MVDIHSHILPGIDDGSESLETSINILKKMASLGFNHIVATPHYITGSSFKCNNENKVNLIRKLQKELDDRNINISIFLGNEVYIDHEILSLIDKGEISVINGKKYLLIELPRNGKINDLYDLIFKLRTRDIVPIIAHPERYICLQEDNSLIDEIVEHGALIQVNFESISAKHGKDSKKLALYLLKNKKIHFLASDIHHEDSTFFNTFQSLKKAIIKIIGEEKFKEVTYTNPALVLNGEFINSEFPKSEKKHKFSIFKK